VKIATVTLRFDAPGGVETNVREVTKRLRAAGAEPRIFASDLYDEDRWERRSDYAPTVDGVPVDRFPVYKRLIPRLTMPLWTGLVPALSESGADVIHAHSHRYGHVLQAAAVARRRRIPFVVSTHYHPANRDEPPLKRGLLRVQDHFFGWTAYRTAAAIIVETDLEADRVSEFVARRKIHKIPPGVDLTEWADPSADRAPADLPERYLLYAGRVAENKGLDVLLRALAEFPVAERPTLVVMGRDWGEQGRLVSLAEGLGVSANVRFLGHLSDRAAYRAVFRGAEGFVLPSEWEAFGLVLLEAMAAGVPIVATAVGGVPEVLEQGRAGRLVPYGDPPALVAAIRGIRSDAAARATLTEEGRRRVQELTWDRCAERHLALYRALAR
jgi:glycosyltransferase involved in cell wall biosynthesis